MTHLVFANAASALRPLIDHVLSSREITPRGLLTREALDVTITISNPQDVTLYGVGRRSYHPAIGAIEGLLMVAGVSDPGLLRKVAPVFETYQDGGVLHGAYGPRLRTQLPAMIERLTVDMHTRQAVCTIWDPSYDLGRADDVPRDLPCTVDLLFRVRDGMLTLKVNMRSNDLWRGWCYDVLQFTMLQGSVANALGVPMGPYVHHASSFHAYERDHGQMQAVPYHRPADPGSDPRPRLYGVMGDLATRDDDPPTTVRWAAIRQHAWRILYDQELPVDQLSPTERWLRAHVARARGWDV